MHWQHDWSDNPCSLAALRWSIIFRTSYPTKNDGATENLFFSGRLQHDKLFFFCRRARRAAKDLSTVFLVSFALSSFIIDTYWHHHNNMNQSLGTETTCLFLTFKIEGCGISVYILESNFSYERYNIKLYIHPRSLTSIPRKKWLSLRVCTLLGTNISPLKGYLWQMLLLSLELGYVIVPWPVLSLSPLWFARTSSATLPNRIMDSKDWNRHYPPWSLTAS